MLHGPVIYRMISCLRTYRCWWTGLLLLLFAVPQGVLTIHQYEEAAHLEHQWQCDSQKGTFHLHDSEHYAAHHCFFCGIALQPASEAAAVDLSALVVLLPMRQPVVPSLFYTNPVDNDRPCRGPPALV